MTSRIGARDLIDLVVDADSWSSWDVSAAHGDVDAEYGASLAAAAERSGCDESVLTGQARIGGREVAMIVSEFRFLGGSIGRATAARIESAIRRATEVRLPLVAAPASGGTRMQEGTPAFVTIVDIARALVDHKSAGVPYLVYLRDPTTGGVLASWGSLGDVTAVEPGALIGFLGPAVVEAVTGKPLPDDVQRAEYLFENGMFDALVRPAELAAYFGRVLDILGDRVLVLPAACAVEATAERVRCDVDAWESITVSRRHDRPGIRELLQFGADRSALAPGATEANRSVLCTLASFGGISCVVIAQDRAAQAASHPIGPADLRLARRWMRLAERLGLPLVCVVDTPGADLSVAAEEGAIAGEIARTIATLVQTSVPSVTVVMGQGSGGGALALLPSRRVVVAENGWVSPLPPEGASTILHGTVALAAEMARQQRVRSADLIDDRVADLVVPESTPAHVAPAQFCQRIATEIGYQLGHAPDARPRHMVGALARLFGAGRSVYTSLSSLADAERGAKRWSSKQRSVWGMWSWVSPTSLRRRSSTTESGT